MSYYALHNFVLTSAGFAGGSFTDCGCNRDMQRQTEKNMLEKKSNYTLSKS